MDEIVLYPGNWLYNAGVIGFLKVLENTGKCVEDYFKNSGEVRIQGIEDIFFNKKNINDVPISTFAIQWLKDSYNVIFKKNLNNSDYDNLDEVEIITKIWGTLFNVLYRGFFNANSNFLFLKTKNEDIPLLQKFDNYILNSYFPTKDISVSPTHKCSFCNKKDIPFSYKNVFSSEHSKVLGASPSLKGMPNAFWNNNGENSLMICDRCSFLLLCQHLSFTTLSDKSKIFINSPSFQVMWHLNQLIKEIYEKGDYHNTQELFGMSLIELTLRLKAQLGTWVGMNIEIITNEQNFIDFYSLPYEVTCMLLDRKIASFISDIGELFILQIILNKNFNKLMELGERLMPLTFKNSAELNKHEKQFINENLRLQKNRNNLSWFVSQILNLYSLIKDRVGGDTT